MGLRISGGDFFVFEGMDGSGKSYVSSMFAHFLELNGYDVVYRREPNGAFRDLIMRELLPKQNHRASVLTFLANRATHVEQVISPALADGKIVVCDRFLPSTLVYYFARVGMDDFARRYVGALIRDIYSWIVPEEISPNYLFLDTSPEVAMSRISGRGQVEIFNDIEHLRKLKAEYDRLSDEDVLGTITRFGSDVPLNEVIWTLINWFINKYGDESLGKGLVKLPNGLLRELYLYKPICERKETSLIADMLVSWRTSGHTLEYVEY